MELVSTAAVNGQTKVAQSSVDQIDCTSNGSVNAKVPAGTFDAIRVTRAYNMAVTTTTQADDGSTSTNTTDVAFAETDEYAAGVGLVHMDRAGDFEENHDLVNYSTK